MKALTERWQAQAKALHAAADNEVGDPYDRGEWRGRALGKQECVLELSDFTRWIPVTERLPEVGGRYEVWFWGSDPDGYASFSYYYASHGWRGVGITHWREAPGGPKP